MLKSIIVSALIIFLLPSISFAQTNNCNRANVEIQYNDSLDYEHACKAINKIIEKFQEFNFESNAPINIHFQEKVAVSYTNEDTGEVIEHRVYALYDSTLNLIQISKFDSDYIRSRKAFDYLDVTRSMHESIIVHELAHRYLHLFYQNVLGSDNPDHATHEFFAYTIQIDLLNTYEKNAVLSLWPESVMDSDLSVNSIIHGAHPHKFGVMAYRYSQDNDILERILSGNFISGDEIMNLMMGY